MALAIALSSVTIIHWVYQPHRWGKCGGEPECQSARVPSKVRIEGTRGV